VRPGPWRDLSPLLAGAATAIGVALRGLERLGRVLTSVAGAIVVNLLVAQGMLAVHRCSVHGGAIAVTVISLLLLLSSVSVNTSKT